jgi:hypothetical protein
LFEKETYIFSDDICKTKSASFLKENRSIDSQAISKAAVDIIAKSGNTTNNGLRPNLSAACCTTDVIRNAVPSKSTHVPQKKKR